jgi:hypothetical protein
VPRNSQQWISQPHAEQPESSFLQAVCLSTAMVEHVVQIPMAIYGLFGKSQVAVPF